VISRIVHRDNAPVP